MTQGSYKQFCPVAMAAEILCTRWTVVLLREMIAGSTRFNDLRRGVPRMSPALLSQRLKELERAGVVMRKKGNEGGLYEYHLTRSGRELTPIVEGFGVWGHRWVETKLSLQNLDAQLLMWDMRRSIDTTPMPDRRSTIQFLYTGAPPNLRQWWLIVTPGEGTDLCSVDPGYDVDLYVASDLKTMTAIWMGFETVRAAVRDERVKLTGDRKLAADMQTWLGLSPFAKEKKFVA
ncbi:MAG: helix-turn-helix transcriptional regulator [Alphaproteobacteria bacterium]|nr:helix-turn-helix transcriptional regulator [Alphaproteobacteria bacterium]